MGDNLVATAVEDKEEQEEKEQKEEKEEKKQSHSRQNTASFLKTLATSAEQKEEEEKKQKEEKKKVMINDTSEAWLSRCVSLFREPLDMDILNTVPTSTTFHQYIRKHCY